MKFGKKGLIAELAILLGVASITTVGLAAYVVTGGVKEATTETEVKDVAIENNIVGITAAKTQDTLLFQPTIEDKEGRLTSKGAGKMELTIPLEIEISENKASAYNLKVTITPVAKELQTITQLETYIVTPETQTIDVSTMSELKLDNGIKKGTYNLNLKWNWGAAFEGVDPCAWEKKNEQIITNSALMEKMNSFVAEVNKVQKYTVQLTLVEKTQ